MNKLVRVHVALSAGGLHEWLNREGTADSTDQPLHRPRSGHLSYFSTFHTGPHGGLPTPHRHNTSSSLIDPSQLAWQISFSVRRRSTFYSEPKQHGVGPASARDQPSGSRATHHCNCPPECPPCVSERGRRRAVGEDVGDKWRRRWGKRRVERDRVALFRGRGGGRLFDLPVRLCAW